MSAGTAPIRTEIFHGFPQSLQAYATIVPLLGYNRFLSNHYQFLIHIKSRYSAQCSLATDSVDKRNRFTTADAFFPCQNAIHCLTAVSTPSGPLLLLYIGMVKLSLCLINKHHAMKTYIGGIAPTFLTSTLDGGEQSASRPSRFTSRERAPVPVG
jgi:hypothetical protein